MKTKTKIILALLILSLGLNAQITKEQSFSGANISIKSAIINDTLNTFVMQPSQQFQNSNTDFASTTFNMSIYSGESIKKATCTLELQKNVESIEYNGFGGFARKVYNVGNNLIYWFSYSGTAAGGNTYRRTKLFDENGISIATFDSCLNVEVFGNTKQGFKLIAHNAYKPKYDIYSLPGKGELDTIHLITAIYSYDTVKIKKYDTAYLSNNTIIQDNEPNIIYSNNSNLLLKPFPNPSSSFICFPYSGDGNLSIYNSSGICIENYYVYSSSNSIIVNISGYPNGVYSFIIVANKTVSGKFEKN